VTIWTAPSGRKGKVGAETLVEHDKSRKDGSEGRLRIGTKTREKAAEGKEKHLRSFLYNKKQFM